MSEYTCYNGHVVPVGKLKCDICGSRIYYEDGRTAHEIEYEERDYYNNKENEDEYNRL